MSEKQKLVLASTSPQRLVLLEKIGIIPDLVFPVNIDETPRRTETPHGLTKRLAMTKAQSAYDNRFRETNLQHSFILTADTIVACGRRVIGKPDSIEELKDIMSLLSGRAHRVYTTVVLVTPKGNFYKKIVETRVYMKKFSSEEIDDYVLSNEWRNKAGGYAIQGIAACFITEIYGSYSNVVGLPLYETRCLLEGSGYKFSNNWGRI